jgi:hypothetical protein
VHSYRALCSIRRSVSEPVGVQQGGRIVRRIVHVYVIWSTQVLVNGGAALAATVVVLLMHCRTQLRLYVTPAASSTHLGFGSLQVFQGKAPKEEQTRQVILNGLKSLRDGLLQHKSGNAPYARCFQRVAKGNRSWLHTPIHFTQHPRSRHVSRRASRQRPALRSNFHPAQTAKA